MPESKNRNAAEAFPSFKQGQESGFAIIFKEWYTPICHFADSILNNIQESEDVVSECFVNLWEKRKDFNTPVDSKSFLYAIVRNRCIDIIRHRKVVRSSEQRLSELTPDNKTFFDQIIISETAAQVQAALDSLPGECRKIFHLLYTEGKRSEEVARAFNISVHTVRAQRQRGLSLLRKKLLSLLLSMPLLPSIYFLFV
ncbi:MAG TPA: RNA polymerase sigma-70 factor [Puia sp.]|nr:RNA polymerase sigma-70 factor [Puia sp.]